MTRIQLLAAEIFAYSYANYLDHLGIGNARFETFMPNDARTLEQALSENWPPERIAQVLGTDIDNAVDLLNRTRNALAVVDAENPAEAFRHAVRQVLRSAVTEGLDDDSVERLVIQICYRVADLANLLDREGTRLSRYSRHLRREPDSEYYDGYFDEED